MTLQVDPTTGMAPLPEGSFWNVTKDSHMYEGQHIYRLRYMFAKRVQVKRLKWYGKLYTKTVIRHVEAFVVPIWNSDNGNRYDWGYASILTPTHLRNASFRALEEYEEEVAKQKRLREQEDNSEELLGNYPPKSLN